MDWIPFLDQWQDLTGAIVGGVIGGLFTFLGLWWTFRNQTKNEYPKKLIITTKIAFDIDEYISDLKEFIAKLEDDNIPPESFLDRNFKEKLITKAVNTDKETYRILLDAFDDFEKQKYHRTVIVYRGAIEDSILTAKRYLEDLTLLRQEISKRIEYYEEKI